MDEEAIRQAVHDLESVLAENRKHIFRATVLNQDNQPLAIGRALLVGGVPIFWPDSPEPTNLQGIDSSSAVALRHSDGTQTAIRDFHLCEVASMTVHYHFRVAS